MKSAKTSTLIYSIRDHSINKYYLNIIRYIKYSMQLLFFIYKEYILYILINDSYIIKITYTTLILVPRS